MRIALPLLLFQAAKTDRLKTCLQAKKVKKVKMWRKFAQERNGVMITGPISTTAGILPSNV